MLYDIVYGRDSDSEFESSDYKKDSKDSEELLKSEIGVDGFTSEFMNMVNVNVVGFILFGISYSYLLWKFVANICYACFWGIHYFAILVWDSLDKGQEWLQLAVIVSSIAATWCVLMFANDMDDRIDNYIAKLKAEIKERSEEHTSELQSHHDIVCRLLLEKNA